MINRWWLYQSERFPLLAHGPAIAAFSFSAVNFSSQLRGPTPLADVKGLFVAFVVTFLFFLLLRIADEFKDQEEDAHYRSYRPVPRGLVRLGELKAVGSASALVQLAVTAWLDLSLVPLLVTVWVYLALMSKEFFVRDWLKRHPFTYMWTHMLILPLIGLYATGCDWMVAGSEPPRELIWFLGMSFFNGMAIEIGRKIRAPEDEEHGVETYSALWGSRNAILAWLGALLLTAATALIAAERIGIFSPFAGLLIVLLGVAAIVAWLFLFEPITKHSRLFQPMSGVWTVFLYAALGTFPWFFDA